MNSHFDNWDIKPDYENWHSIYSGEYDDDEICKNLTPVTRLEPLPYELMFGETLQDVDTIPNYIYKYIDYDEYPFRTGVAVVMTFDKNKNLHSFGGKPAINSDANVFTHKEWYLHGIRHRTHGAAIIFGELEGYYIEGKQPGKEAFDVYRFYKGY